MTRYSFPAHDDFLNRQPELAALRRWYEGDGEPAVLVLYGRRRTGKSWLFREFANGRDADIFVCDRRVALQQLAEFSAQLEAEVGARPQLQSSTELFEVLANLAERGRRLAVIDEFPELYGSRGAPDSELAAVLERRNRTGLKLILCGSQISTMQKLFRSRGPLHGRTRSMALAPLTFRQAQAFLESHQPGDVIQRYAIAGGMPRYLVLLRRKQALKTIVCDELIDPSGTLFQEPRTVLDMELSETAIYFSLLTALAGHRDLSHADLLNKSKVSDKTAGKYLRTLADLQLVEAANPMFTAPTARQRRYRLRDHLMRFWFRFVLPYQQTLEAGLAPILHYERNVEPFLEEHVSWTFEEICRAWTLERYQEGTDSVGSWWGPARHDLRRKGERTTEEIDVVGAHRRRATVLGEVKWTGHPMGVQVLRDLEQYKIPALEQSGVDAKDAEIVLFSRSGFAQALQSESALQSRKRRVRLVSISEI
jgi:AAA+ ATPase superfamily predicted ATPase